MGLKIIGAGVIVEPAVIATSGLADQPTSSS